MTKKYLLRINGRKIRVVGDRPSDMGAASSAVPADPDSPVPETFVDPVEAFGAEVQDELEKSFSLFALAGKNLVTYFWMNAKMIFVFACLAFLICLFTVYNAAINERKEMYTRASASANYLITNSAAKVKSFKELGPDITYEDYFRAHMYSTLIYNSYGVGGVWHASSAYFNLGIEGEVYQAYGGTVSFCSVAHPENAFFTQADYVELKESYGYDSFFSAGHYPAAPDEIAVNENVLAAYRLLPEDVLGKEISFLFKPKTGEAKLQFKATVCGILRKELLSLTGHKANCTNPSFLFHWDNAFFQSSTDVRYRCYLNGWPDYATADMWKEQFTSQTTNTSYVGSGLLERIDMLEKIQTLAANLYVIIGSALVVGLILTIFLMIDKYMRVLSRTGGILMTFGMRRSHLYALLAIQLLLMCLIAFPLAVGLTSCGYYVINFLIHWVTGINLALSFLRVLVMLLIGIGCVVAIAIVFYIYGAFRLRHHTIKQFLSTEVK